MCACVRVCECVYVCVYVCVCVCSIPAEYGSTRLSSPSLSLGGYQQPKYVCLSMHGGQKKMNCRRSKAATHGCSMYMNLRHFKTWRPVYGRRTATYVSLTTGDAFAAYGRSLDRKLSEKWVFPWFSRLKSVFSGHAG